MEAAAQRGAERPVAGPEQQRKPRAQARAVFAVVVPARAGCEREVRTQAVLGLGEQGRRRMADIERRERARAETVGLYRGAGKPGGVARDRARF